MLTLGFCVEDGSPNGGLTILGERTPPLVQKKFAHQGALVVGILETSTLVC